MTFSESVPSGPFPSALAGSLADIAHSTIVGVFRIVNPAYELDVSGHSPHW